MSPPGNYRLRTNPFVCTVLCFAVGGHMCPPYRTSTLDGCRAGACPRRVQELPNLYKSVRLCHIDCHVACAAVREERALRMRRTPCGCSLLAMTNGVACYVIARLAQQAVAICSLFPRSPFPAAKKDAACATSFLLSFRAEAGFEVGVAELRQPRERAVFAAAPDVRQRHPVEGIVLARRVNCHIPEHEQVARLRRAVKAVVPDDVPGEARRPGQPRRVLSRAVRAVKRRGIGHFQHVGHMAGGAGVQDRDARRAVLHDVQHAADEEARSDSMMTLRISTKVMFSLIFPRTI